VRALDRSPRNSPHPGGTDDRKTSPPAARGFGSGIGVNVRAGGALAARKETQMNPRRSDLSRWQREHKRGHFCRRASFPETIPQPSRATVVESRMNQILLENSVAKTCLVPIVRTVKWNWKWLPAAGLLVVVALGAGCSGIHASKSISPATFLLPGLIKNDAPAAQDSMPAAPPGELFAQN
jgi:hypothetical protein